MDPPARKTTDRIGFAKLEGPIGFSAGTTSPKGFDARAVTEVLESAKSQRCTVVMLEVESPGGIVPEGEKVVEALLGIGADALGEGDQRVDPSANTGQEGSLERIDINGGEEHDPSLEGHLAVLDGDAPGGLPIPESEAIDFGKIVLLEPGQRLPAGMVAKSRQDLVGGIGEIGKREPVGG